MKYLFSCLLILSSSAVVFAQEKSETNGFFKKENVFTGGTLNIAFSDQISSLGISPYLGYSFNKYIDIAASAGVNYTSQRDYKYPGDKLRQTILTPGAFIRIFPLKFLFAQLHYEYNSIKQKYIGTYSNNEESKGAANCLLMGFGISNGKNFSSQKSYYYFSILWDKGKTTNLQYTPYKDNLQRAVPIIRAGYNIALFQGKR
jgi:hypothetical protein